MGVDLTAFRGVNKIDQALPRSNLKSEDSSLYANRGIFAFKSGLSFSF
jgi:hypothetical protein